MIKLNLRLLAFSCLIFSSLFSCTDTIPKKYVMLPSDTITTIQIDTFAMTQPILYDMLCDGCNSIGYCRDDLDYIGTLKKIKICIKS